MIITRAIYLLLKILPIQFQSIVLYLRKKYVFYNNVLRIILHFFTFLLKLTERNNGSDKLPEEEKNIA